MKAYDHRQLELEILLWSSATSRKLPRKKSS